MKIVCFTLLSYLSTQLTVNIVSFSGKLSEVHPSLHPAAATDGNVLFEVGNASVDTGGDVDIGSGTTSGVQDAGQLEALEDFIPDSDPMDAGSIEPFTGHHDHNRDANPSAVQMLASENRNFGMVRLY